jgi:acyl-coenzyme A synthetase/AMP-(fatty) acid ligase
VCFGESGERVKSQLRAHAHALSDRLSRLPRGEAVVLGCRDRYLFSAGLLAALQRGLVCFLPEGSQPEALLRAYEHSGARALLHDNADIAMGVDVRELEGATEQPTAPLGASLSLEDVAFVALTSGSTGKPQAHAKCLGQLLLEASAHAEHFDLAGARVASAVPAHHIYGLLFGVLAPLLSGGSLLRETPLFPRSLIASVERHDADVVVAVPAHLSALAKETELELPAVRHTFSSAGPLPRATAEALNARGLTITEIFGSTEVGGVASRTSTDAPWVPFSGVEIGVASQGTLRVRSAWSSRERGAWTETSDRVRLVPGGFEHAGRADNVVKVGGRRVDLRDLELQLERVQGVQEARVIAVAHSGAARDLALWAVVVGAGLGVEPLRAALAERFNPVTWPRRFRFVDRLPRADTGKVTRAALLALFDEPNGSEVPDAVASWPPTRPVTS